MPSPDASAGNVTKGSSYRSACTECQRRKQKCNREWPCNHCQKRKVADKCHFKDSSQPIPAKAVEESRRKRRLEADHDESESDDNSDSDGIDALGYMPTHLLYGLTSQNEQPTKAPSREYVRSARSYPQLERALHVIPPRPYTDTLVQNFLNNANYHYYIIYPPSFLDQYHKWWTDRAANRPLCIQWTCLFLMVCACALQNTDFELRRKLELDLGVTAQRLSEQYHEAARELGGAIPLGYSHFINVQQLLHSCYWFKSEARFQESWHVLNSAIREAQELAMNKESPEDAISEFDLEIRRRVWCVLDAWDWQISALLGRPMIIDRADCNVGLPSLTLEGMIHNPLIHIKLQSELIRKLFGRFGLTKNVATPRDVQEYQYMIESWMETFPPPLDVYHPDQSLDAAYPWIVLHRHYIRTTAFSMLLDPIRAYLARAFTIDSTDAERKIRSDGINYCLELMVSLNGFFEYVYPWDPKYHYVLFCVFDTSTVLCSAVLHDEHHTLPRRDDVFRAIDEALAMLQRLNTVTKSAKTSYGILSRIVQRLPRTVVLPRSLENDTARHPRGIEVPISPPTVSPHYVSPQHFSSPMVTPPGPSVPAEVASAPGEAFGYGAYAMAAPFDYAEWQPNIHSPIAPGPVGMHMPNGMVESQYISAGLEGIQDGSFANISDRELGELASFWNYSSLDFEFFPPQLQL